MQASYCITNGQVAKFPATACVLETQSNQTLQFAGPLIIFFFQLFIIIFFNLKKKKKKKREVLYFFNNSKKYDKKLKMRAHFIKLYKAPSLYLVIWWSRDRRIHFHTLKNITFLRDISSTQVVPYMALNTLKSLYNQSNRRKRKWAQNS